jgi:hypothetical protein
VPHDEDPSPATDPKDAVSRPEPTVLHERTLVPAANLVRPVPNTFTHRVVADQPYWYRSGPAGRAADGVLPAGHRVVVLVTGIEVDGVAGCRVVDEQGLYVVVRAAGVRPLLL